METIGGKLLSSFLDRIPTAKYVKNGDVRRGFGHQVGSFLELATKVAELQFRNREHVLLFRGQTKDFRNLKGNTTLKPTLFRPVVKGSPKLPSEQATTERFEELRRAEQLLVRLYAEKRLLGIRQLERQRILRWSILQHYGVCPTPLLDVTQSLRIASSIASFEARNLAFVFVLGVPNLSGAITASAEAGLQIVRLSSACPPSAIRPHLQEGYLLGEYPDMADYGQKEHYSHYEIDFGRRLIAKFCFDPKSFWKDDTFPKVEKEALYPNKRQDALQKLTLEIKQSISR
jgi:hypothetical protein